MLHILRPQERFVVGWVGLGEYCQPLPDLDVLRLIDQFTALETRVDEVTPMIEKKAKEYRNLLEEQYDLIFGELEHLPKRSIASQPTARGPRELHETSR